MVPKNSDVKKKNSPDESKKTGFEGFDVEANIEELRKIHPLGPEIARDRMRGGKWGTYNKIAKRRHVTPNTISAVVDFMLGRHPEHTDSVQLLMGNKAEGAEKDIVAMLEEICRIAGTFSKTEAAILLRELVRPMMRYATQVGLRITEKDIVEKIVKAAHDQGKREGTKEGADACVAKNHQEILEEGRRRGRAAGLLEKCVQETDGIWKAAREDVREELTRSGVVPLLLAQNLRNRISWNERHVIKLCPYCDQAITSEVCKAIGEKLPPEKRAKLEELRKTIRQRTGEWSDPDPTSTEFPPWYADRMLRVDQDLPL